MVTLTFFQKPKNQINVGGGLDEEEMRGGFSLFAGWTLSTFITQHLIFLYVRGHENLYFLGKKP
jgi:hypothetical protein